MVPSQIPSAYLSDATESRGLEGSADAIVFPASAAQVAEVMQWCYARGIPVTPRGGGTGYAGGAIPNGGVVVCMERMNAVRSFLAISSKASIPSLNSSVSM